MNFNPTPQVPLAPAKSQSAPITQKRHRANRLAQTLLFYVLETLKLALLFGSAMILTFMIWVMFGVLR